MAMSQELVQYSYVGDVEEIDGVRQPRRMVQMKVDVKGVVESHWKLPQVGAGLATLDQMAREVLPLHRAVLEEMLGHRGDVAVALFNRWKDASGTPSTIRIVKQPVTIQALPSSEFLESLEREMRRSVGELVFEPEERA